MARAARQIRLSGIFPAAITPHHPKTREADYSGALELIDFLAAAGVDGICLFGSTGEFINYSFAERHRLLSLAVKRSRVPLIAGVSHSTLSGALQLADDAISAGAGRPLDDTRPASRIRLPRPFPVIRAARRP